MSGVMIYMNVCRLMKFYRKDDRSSHAPQFNRQHFMNVSTMFFMFFMVFNATTTEAFFMTAHKTDQFESGRFLTCDVVKGKYLIFILSVKLKTLLLIEVSQVFITELAGQHINVAPFLRDQPHKMPLFIPYRYFLPHAYGQRLVLCTVNVTFGLPAVEYMAKDIF